MKFAVEYIAKRIPAISPEYKREIRYDRHGIPFFRLTYKDIEMPSDIATGFRRMYHSADIHPSTSENRYAIILSLRWETLQGGENGVTILNEFIKE